MVGSTLDKALLQNPVEKYKKKKTDEIITRYPPKQIGNEAWLSKIIITNTRKWVITKAILPCFKFVVRFAKTESEREGGMKIEIDT